MHARPATVTFDSHGRTQGKVDLNNGDRLASLASFRKVNIEALVHRMDGPSQAPTKPHVMILQYGRRTMNPHLPARLKDAFWNKKFKMPDVGRNGKQSSSEIHSLAGFKIYWQSVQQVWDSPDAT